MNTLNQSLPDLGWSNFFQSQLAIDEYEACTPARVSQVHRNGVNVLSVTGTQRVELPKDFAPNGVSVGDWLLLNADATPARMLERKSLLQRMGAGEQPVAQLIAANVDTLFIVSSCNADFNVARIERYLALAHQAEVTPVILLTKVDLCDDPNKFLDEARRGLPGVLTEVIDATASNATEIMAPWCGTGQTLALLGSSGVGKSTLANALTGAAQETQGIREDDARGRHTTTARSMHAISGGGWLIDTPGMRALRLYDLKDGVDAVFEDIVELAEGCRFSDCAHDTEPGCAVQNAITNGDLDAARMQRWQKLVREDARHLESIAQARARGRRTNKIHAGGKARTKEKRRGPS